MALITLIRATEMVPNFASSDNAVMNDIINAASETIERYCGRTFALTTYDELYDGPGYANLLLNNYPVTQMLRVAFQPINVLQIRNSDQGVSRASFRIDGTTASPPAPNNLYLVSLKNGVETDHTISLSTTTMISDLATAINAFYADGWNALALGNFASYPVADLRPPIGAYDCRFFGNSYVRLHGYNMPDFEVNPDNGEIVSSMRFNRGYRNYRIVYQAGYSTIPNPIQQACAALSASVYNSIGQNPALASESLGGYSYAALSEKNFKALDFISKYALELYKNRRIPKFTVG